MAFLDKNGLQTLTNKLVQGDAIKVASHRGHTVKNVIDNITRECENVATPNTMTLENRVSEFKVGKGRDVDVSGDVEEGKIEVELQGKTYQNCFIEKAPWFSTETTLETSSTVAVGLSNRNQNHYDIKLIKSNTTYTIIPIVDFKDNYLADFYVQLNLGYEPVNSMFRIYSYDFNKPTVITTKTIVNPNAHSLFIGGSSKGDGVGSVKISSLKLLILEGDYSQTLIEELPLHFEGIQSSFEDGIVDVEVQGKNLFNKAIDEIELENEVLLEKIDEKEFNLSFVEGKLSRGIFKKLIGTGKKQTLSIDTKFIQGQYGNSLSVVIREANFGISYAHYKIPNNSQYTRARMSFIVPKGQEYWILLYKSLQTDPSCKVGFRNIQIDNYCSNVEYEPYYKKKISFNIGEPLRSLPNGVCDEIRNNNGQWELVRRVGKVILNGSEVGWANWSVADGGGYYLYVDGINGSKRLNIKACRPICDTLKVVPSIYATRNKGIAITTGSYISVGFEENIVPPENLSAMKRWFADNPTTVIFELREPVITPIEPIEFEIKPLAIMIINSDISPTSNHKVILNRAGQIEQGILKIAELRKRVDELETAYENQLIETQLKLSLLDLDYKLEKEEI